MLQIQATLTTRQWMRAAKAWRCHLELPADKILAAQLTAYIDSKMHVTLVGPDGSEVDINPAFVVDVPKKGKRFFLVIETCWEGQAKIGPYLTNIDGESITVKIAAEHQPTDVEPVPQAQRGDINSAILGGLHAKWFRNEKFWRFLTHRTRINIPDEATCKVVFKHYMKVNSCTELTQAAFDAMLQDFNAHVSQR